MRAAVQARLDEFTSTAQRSGVASVETRMLEDDARFALLLESRYADLVVVSREAEPITVPGMPVQVRALPEYISLHGARPVLVVPPGWHEQALNGTVVVGWDGSMQALRAISAALPLLQVADAVKLILINPEAMADMHGEEPGADMAPACWWRGHSATAASANSCSAASRASCWAPASRIDRALIEYRSSTERTPPWPRTPALTPRTASANPKAAPGKVASTAVRASPAASTMPT